MNIKAIPKYIKQCEEVLRNKEYDDPDIYYYLAMAYYEYGLWFNAAIYFEKSILYKSEYSEESRIILRLIKTIGVNNEHKE